MNKRLFMVRPDDAEDAERVSRFVSRTKVKLRVVVEPYKPNRSLSANALAHLWISVLAKHIFDTTGQQWPHDDLWEAVKRKTLAPKVVPNLDTSGVVLVYETRNLKTTEFTDWLRAIEAYCLEKWHLQLPHPEDLYDEAQGRK